MGKTADQLQREIAEQRSKIERRIDALEGRVRDARPQASRELGHRVQLRGYVEQRPLAALAGALGIGVALGMFSGGARNGAASMGSRMRDYGLLDDVIGLAAGLVAGPLRDELRHHVRESGGDGRIEEYEGDQGGRRSGEHAGARTLSVDAQDELDAYRDSSKDRVAVDSAPAARSDTTESSEPRESKPRAAVANADIFEEPSYYPSEPRKGERHAEPSRYY
jgi:hypothetical protein